MSRASSGAAAESRATSSRAPRQWIVELSDWDDAVRQRRDGRAVLGQERRKPAGRPRPRRVSRPSAAASYRANTGPLHHPVEGGAGTRIP